VPAHRAELTRRQGSVQRDAVRTFGEVVGLIRQFPARVAPRGRRCGRRTSRQCRRRRRHLRRSVPGPSRRRDSRLLCASDRVRGCAASIPLVQQRTDVINSWSTPCWRIDARTTVRSRSSASMVSSVRTIRAYGLPRPRSRSISCARIVPQRNTLPVGRANLGHRGLAYETAPNEKGGETAAQPREPTASPTGCSDGTHIPGAATVGVFDPSHVQGPTYRVSPPDASRLPSRLPHFRGLCRAGAPCPKRDHSVNLHAAWGPRRCISMPPTCSRTW
jgi:hypothetical protein